MSKKGAGRRVFWANRKAPNEPLEKEEIEMFDRHDLLQPPPGRLLLLVVLWATLIAEAVNLVTGWPGLSSQPAIVTTFLILVVGVVAKWMVMVVPAALVIALAYEVGLPSVSLAIQAVVTVLLTAAIWPRKIPPTLQDEEVPHG